MTRPAEHRIRIEIGEGAEVEIVECTIGEFLASNEHWSDGDPADLEALAIGARFVGGGGAAPVYTITRIPRFEIAISDGCEPDDPDPMLVTDDDDAPIRFASEAAAIEWSAANYPEWIIANMGDGHDWKRFGFHVRPERAP